MVRHPLLVTIAAGALLIAAGPITGCAAPDDALPAAADGFRAELVDSAAPTTSAAGEQVLSWRTSWRLIWAPVPGAAGYKIFYRTSEGGDNQPTRTVDVAELNVEAAAGTSPETRLPADRAAALAITAAQLTVAVAPLTRNGVLGPRSRWFPVGEPLMGDP